MVKKEPIKISRQEVKNQLEKLTKEFQKLPKTKTRKPKKPNTDQELSSIQETIDYLRVCIKYNIFDLEATRREIEWLKKRNKELGGSTK